MLQLDAGQVSVIQDALLTTGALVPDGHRWTPEERRLWEKAYAVAEGKHRTPTRPKATREP